MLSFFILLVSYYEFAHSDTLVVTIDQGRIIGHKYGEIYSFMNIPYATAPTGEDRFKAPLPPPTWTSLDAVDRRIACLQQNLRVPISTEDCLVANVFVPETNCTNLPVMVVVHGGAYIEGTGNTELFTDLVSTKKLIVVSFNYRLGVFGFLCLGTKDIPGNAGMKDQVALLRWVKRNIASFGGNPDDVTICGCSAGGGAVDLLSISPMAAGLFKKVISGSGASLGTLGVVMDPLENAKIYARLLNFTKVDDIDALEHFYKTYPTHMYLDTTQLVHENASNLLFTPCIETDNGEEMFFSDSPWNIIRNKDYVPYPLLKGLTNQEGTVRIEDYIKHADDMLDHFYDFLPGDLQFETEEQRLELAETVKRYYFGDKSEMNINNFIDYYSDTLFNYPILRTLNEHKKANNDTIYLLEYSYVNRLPFLNNSFSTLTGADHCSQHFAVIDDNTPNISPSYLKMKQMMREIYLSFIIGGKPSATGLPDWPPMTEKWSPHMAMKEEPEVLDTLTFHRRAEMWDEIYSKYTRHPIPPPARDVTRTMP